MITRIISISICCENVFEALDLPWKANHGIEAVAQNVVVVVSSLVPATNISGKNRLPVQPPPFRFINTIESTME